MYRNETLRKGFYKSNVECGIENVELTSRNDHDQDHEQDYEQDYEQEQNKEDKDI